MAQHARNNNTTIMKEVLLERYSPEQSSLVEYLTFDAEKQTLEVKYKSGKHKGKIRKYKNFIKEEFDYITNGESAGKRLLAVLKRKQDEQKKASIWGFMASIWGAYK